MKTLHKLSLVVLNVLALASCAKEPETSPDEKQNELHFVIRTSESNTKSYIENNLDGTYTPKWSEGDKLAMFIGDISSNTKPTAIFSATVSENGSKATFEGTVNNVAEEGTFNSFAPADAFEIAYSNGTVGITLNAIQKPSSLTFDEACDILVAKPCFYMASDEEVLIDGLYFKRMFSVLKVNLKGVEALNGETVKSFTVTASNATLTGRAAIDLSSASISQWNVKNNSVKALYENNAPVFGGEDGLENTIWLVVNPTTAAAGSKLTFNAETEKYSIEKEVTLTSDLIFPESQIAVINISINEGDYSAITSEDRIFVEKFTNATESKKTYQPSETGATGTGVTSELNYVYTGSNTNIRFNNNGHSSNDPYLYIPDNGEFTINNLKVKNESSLKFSCQARSNSGTAEVSIKYKESSSETWNIAGKFTATTNSFDNIQSTIFTINPTTTSIDLIISGSAVLVDDIVIESYVDNRTVLNVPGNVRATVDAETPNKVKAEWNAVGNAGSYVVTATPADGEPVSKEVTETSCTFEGLAYETAYTVSVYAKPADTNLYRDSEVATCQIMTGEKPEGTAEWVATPFTDLKDGAKVVIVRTSGNSVALSNDNGTSSAPSAIAVSYTGNTLNTEPTSNIVWYVGIEGNNVIFYTGNDRTKWLYCTATNNGVRVGTNDAKTFAWDSNYLKHIGTSRYIGVYNNQDWRCYTSTTTNINNQTFLFFVKNGSSSDTPKELTSLSWTGYKNTYTVGSTFSVDGTIKAIYSDNSEKTLSAEDVQIVTEPDLTKAGTTTAKISYAEGDITVSAEAAITVKEASQGGETTTVTISGDFSIIENGLQLISNGITITQLKGNGNAPNSGYNKANTLRIYSGNTITFESEYVITKIEFTHTASYAGGQGTTSDVGTYTKDSTSSIWSGSSNKITITNLKGTDSSTKQLRPTVIQVTYEN